MDQAIVQDPRPTVCISLLVRLRTDPFLPRIVAGDEKWLSSNQIIPKNELYFSERFVSCIVSIWWDSGIVRFESLKPEETSGYCRLVLLTITTIAFQIVKKRRAVLDKKCIAKHKSIFFAKSYLCVENIKRRTKKQTKQGESQARSNRVATTARRNEKKIFITATGYAVEPC